MAVREAALHAVSTDGVFIDIEISEEYEDVPKESLVSSSHVLFLPPNLSWRGNSWKLNDTPKDYLDIEGVRKS